MTRLATLDRMFARAATADVWIDDLGRVRRIVGNADLTVVSRSFDPPAGPGLWRELRAQCEFYDYGTPLSGIAAPANVFAPASTG